MFEREIERESERERGRHRDKEKDTEIGRDSESKRNLDKRVQFSMLN